MKRTLAAAVAVVAIAAATPALAADFILTDDSLIEFNPGPTPEVFSQFFISSGNPSGPTVGATLRNSPTGSFVDRYIFAPLFLGIGSGSTVTDVLAGVTYGIPGLRIDGYDLATAGAGVQAALLDAFSTGSAASYNADVSALTTYLNGSPAAAYTQFGVPSGLDRQLALVPLDTANFYVITIDGTATGTGGYAGTLTATSVPEPATWAMMLAGFGLIGFAMRRQRQSHPKVRFAF